MPARGWEPALLSAGRRPCGLWAISPSFATHHATASGLQEQSDGKRSRKRLVTSRAGDAGAPAKKKARHTPRVKRANGPTTAPEGRGHGVAGSGRGTESHLFMLACWVATL